jgi:hypothetical protein
MASQVLSSSEIRAIFSEEIEEAGGDVSEVFEDGDRLFARSILPWVADVRPADEMKGGVALRADGPDVSVHPYLFRMVCRNGAIRAHAIQTRQLDVSEILTPYEAEVALRESVRACCAREAFTEGLEEVRSALASSVDLAITVAPFLGRMPAATAQQIVSRFFESGDRSRFSLMNAVTSVARDTRDPDLRWRLEELGGGIPVVRTPTGSPDSTAEALLAR